MSMDKFLEGVLLFFFCFGIVLVYVVLFIVAIAVVLGPFGIIAWAAIEVAKILSGN